MNMPSHSASPNSDSPNAFGITGDAKANVPVFSCIVYVRHNNDGTVAGRVANFPGIAANGNSERDVLGKVVRVFKSRVSKMLEDGREIPLADPPLPPLDNELMRSVPVHL